MPTVNIYLKIESIANYNPVNPEPKPMPPRQYKRDCMRNTGHDDGTIPDSEVAARAVSALIYREYLDPTYAIPKPDKIVPADINEPSYYSRVPGTVIYAHPGDRLHIHVLNGDSEPHSFHLHGLSYGIDSDGAWPLGTQAKLGPLPGDVRRSDEICPGQMWTYTYDITPEMVGAWPFHDHYKRIGEYVNRGLFGGLIVRPSEHPHPPHCALPPEVEEFLEKQRKLHPLPLPVPEPGPEVERMRDYLMEFVEFPENRPVIHPEHPLDVPLFFHAMSAGGTPAFDSGPLAPGAMPFVVSFGSPGQFQFHCNFHPQMHGTVNVVVGGAASATFNIIDFQFLNPVTGDNTASIAPGGSVQWIQAGANTHTVTDDGGGLPSICFNGRSFVGNTPTIVAHTGQKIHWYVFNLDLGMVWHNFHPHAQRWTFADATVDVRSISPAESFVLETIAPPVLLLPPDIEKTQEPKKRPKDAKQYKLRGDFLVHCHIEPHMMQGLACLVRSHQTVWLTDAQRDELVKTTGLPLDPGDNACPVVKLDRCASIASGKWEEVPGHPAVTMMHTTLLAQTDKALFWGYGDPPIPRSSFPNTTQLWDPVGGYTLPSNQPTAFNPPGQPTFANLHSAGHAYLDDGEGTLIAHGGETAGAAPSNAGNQQALLFHPSTTKWELVNPTQGNRFYATTMTLNDGRLLTIYGNANTIEVFKPGPKTWDPEIALPVAMNYRYYPWAYLLPGGDIFIAGHQALTTRFSWTPAVVVRGQWTTINGDRSPGGGELGTSVLLALRPPGYQPHVLIAAGRGATAQTAEMIDLSSAMPAWMPLADLQRAHPQQCTATLLPDGRVFLAGGTESAPGVLAPGPGEIFDPADPASGWKLTPPMTYARGYHSSAILLTDGSVLMGGDPPDAMGMPTPHERFFPGYCSVPRPAIAGAPTSVAHGATFTINTPDAPSIAEVVLVRPGAVTHGFNQTQRLVGCAFTGAANTLLVQTPPNDNIGRNAAPPGWYLLFIIDAGRVPSVAKWIRLTP